eukprot:TRINITY_DN17245_c0_g1_i1.p1 TRINITY_DN17245_c0_g1~~TRINITY_DN17245_c0_g1_i1.p1  ORF type:complete len:187 (+),score=42.74 TRINITY_DN17245_c0_g1_i1:51-611(+)
MKSFFILCLLALIGVIAAEEPNLIAFKELDGRDVIHNTPFRINVTIYNVGEGAAFDVSVTDDSWVSSHFRLGGTNVTNAKFDRIPAASNVTYSYTVTPIEAGDVFTGAAKILYRPGPKSNFRIVRSSTLGLLPVETVAAAAKRTASHIVDYILFLVLAALAVLPAGYIYQQTELQIQSGRYRAKGE